MSYLYTVLTAVAVFSLLTLALNVQFGQAGIVNFGLVAYFLVGAYSYALLTQPAPSEVDQYVIGLGLSPWIGVPGAIVAATVFAYIVSLPILRLDEDYLALAMFALAQVVGSVLVNVPALANGTIGLSNIAPPAVDSIPFEDYDMWIMIAALVVLAAVFFPLDRLTKSPFGATLRATRDDPMAAAALGKHVERFRLKAFLVGAAIAGLAGVMYSSYTTVASPGLFTADVTFTAFIALVIGGLGSNAGAVAGALLFFGIEEVLSLIPVSGDTAQLVASARLIPFGIALVLVLRFAPQGLLGGRRRSPWQLIRRSRADRQEVHP
jgi:branched-chain amino acid transport system permease protein